MDVILNRKRVYVCEHTVKTQNLSKGGNSLTTNKPCLSCLNLSEKLLYNRLLNLTTEKNQMLFFSFIYKLPIDILKNEF